MRKWLPLLLIFGKIDSKRGVNFDDDDDEDGDGDGDGDGDVGRKSWVGGRLLDFYSDFDTQRLLFSTAASPLVFNIDDTYLSFSVILVGR